MAHSRADGSVTFALSGLVNEAALPDLEQLVHRVAHTSPRIFIDLSEVTLLDRAAARWLSVRNRENITCINCPGYISPWISS